MFINRFNKSFLYKITIYKGKNNIIFYRKLSNGINKWNEDLNTSIKLEIEDYWSEKINKNEYRDNLTERNKYFVLSMFPYPSGKLHMGHVRVYSISDAIARYYRMNGDQVIHPMGWDAFGLPAENAAIECKIPPKKWTYDNIAIMKKQLQHLGCSFDWSREIATCDPNYYKWTQHLFLTLYEHGLVYQKEALVNWDPVDQTVLADEQVDSNGCSWRSGAKVELKPLKQWFIRTTKFAKSLLDGLNDPILEQWRDIIKLQKHWIGECNGVRFEFPVSNEEYGLSVWTPYPEYVEISSFIAVKEDSLLGTKCMTEKIQLKAINPLTGKEIPILITNDVNYADGADSHLGIPFVSEQDYEIAIRHDFQITKPTQEFDSPPEKLNKQNSICQKAQLLNAGGYWVGSKLRDWLISRQRFWGTPIPIVKCEKCGIQPVSKEELPIRLPDLNELSKKGFSSLLETPEWINTNCPVCKKPAIRETDTMDTFVDSSWYFLRFMDPHNDTEPFSKANVMKLAPVDLYIGGKEHAVLHLYYARFISHFLHSLGLLPEREPFKKLLVQGMVNGRTYRLKGTGQYLKEKDVEITDLKKGKAVEKVTGQPVTIAWEKMSKSKHNGVDPNDMFQGYSVDTTRLLILADVAPTSPRNWNTATFPGILNWEKRLWLTVRDFINYRKNLPPVDFDSSQFKSQEENMWDSRNYYIKGVNFNMLFAQQLSVVISKMQGLTNSIRRSTPDVIGHGKQFEHALATQLIMLAPLAPHFASELWSGFASAPHRINQDAFDWSRDVSDQEWPVVDDNYQCELDFVVNGVNVSAHKIVKPDLNNLTHSNAYELAMLDKKVLDYIDSRRIVKAYFNLYKDCGAKIHFIIDQKTKKTADQSA